ncbi:MAG: VWA domain-containing protein [Acidobacteriota bacterium]|nr:VWA domain-containing protein [Acidobacteriota bacterium]
MKRATLSITVALLTFVVGVSASTAWLIKSRRQQILFTQPTNKAIRPGVTVDSAGKPTLEMVFVLDTTGSMSGLIEGAKQRIWGIVNDVMQTPSRPNVRIGLVAYRDRQDAYVTQVLPLTDDLDKVYSTLMDYRAEGGGDEPEDVRRALAAGVREVGWSQTGTEHVARIVFLVGDAPPHDDYADAPSTEVTVSEAVRLGMTVNTIQCGNSPATKVAWQAVARGGEGQYFAIAQDGGVENIATPYDTRLSELGTKLGSTFLAYGGGGGAAGTRIRQDIAATQASHEMKVARNASMPAAADRAVNKALNERAYAGDLLQNLENESVKLEAVKDEDLPNDLRKLSPEARRKETDRRLDERRRIRAEIVSLSKQRDAFLAASRKKQSSDTRGGFDTAVAVALKEQMARRGIK